VIAACLLLVAVAAHADPTHSPAFAARSPDSDLTPEARPFNERAIKLVEAGHHAAGLAELERAYALMPDPLVHRKGRSEVLGAIRGTLLYLYDATGDPVYLERVQVHLLQYTEALLFALGDAATQADVEIALAALYDVSAQLTALQPTPPLPTSLPVPPREPPVPATLRPAPARPVVGPVQTETSAGATGGRRMRLAGGVLIGVGVAALGVTTGAAVASADSRGKLRRLTGALAEPGPSASPALWQQGERHYHRAGVYQAVAITTGVLGGVALASGIALYIVGKRRTPGATRSSLTPLLAPGVVGVLLGGAF